MNIFNIMPNFLRDPDAFFREVQEGKDVREKSQKLALVSILCFMAYGLMVGLSKSPLQALSSGVKMPILFLVSMAFCLPALYFFSLALLATPLKMMQVLTIVLSAMGVTSFLLLGLAPITLFFVLTSSNYSFFQLMAVAFTGLSALIGVYFLWRGMTFVDAARDDASRQLGRRILSFWIVLYGFVGTQMTWRLSPFIGNPDDPFYLIKPSRDNFYVDVIHAIQNALQIPASDASWFMPMLTTVLCLAAFVVMLSIVMKFIGTGSKQRRLSEKSSNG